MVDVFTIVIEGDGRLLSPRIHEEGNFRMSEERVLHRHLERLERTQERYRKLRTVALRRYSDASEKFRELRKTLEIIRQHEVELSERRISVLRDLASSLAARTAAFSTTLRHSTRTKRWSPGTK